MRPFHAALAEALHKLGVHPRHAVELATEFGDDLLLRGYSAPRAALALAHVLEFWN